MSDKNENKAMNEENKEKTEKLNEASASEEKERSAAEPAAEEDSRKAEAASPETAGKEPENKKSEKKKDKRSKKNKPQVDKRNKTLKRTAWISVLVLIAIVITVNVILNSLVGAKWQFDWTANKAASIGDITEQILEENDKKVKVVVLANRDGYGSRIAAGDLSFIPNLLDQYEEVSDGTLEVHYENPVENPAVLTEIDPNNVHQLKQNQIVVANEDYSKLKVLTPQDLIQVQQYYVTGYTAEEALTGAVRLVTSDFTPVVYLTEGHGEAEVDKYFTILNMLLEQNNYLVKSFDSLTAEAVPEDAELLLMLSPKNDISSGEAEVYLDFLKKGGSFMVMVDYGTFEMPNLNSLLREFNLKLTNDLIQENDTQKAFADDSGSFIADIKGGKLYSPNNTMDYAVVIDSRAVTSADSAQDWIKTEPVLTSSDQATRLIGGDKNNVSQPAKQNAAMFSENTGFMDGTNVTKSAKVAVFGSAYPFMDAILYNYMNTAGNYLLANSAMSYMSNMAEHSDESLLIQPKGVVSYAIAPKSQSSVQFMSVMFMAIIPAALLVTALAVYQKRKHL